MLLGCGHADRHKTQTDCGWISSATDWLWSGVSPWREGTTWRTELHWVTWLVVGWMFHQFERFWLLPFHIVSFSDSILSKKRSGPVLNTITHKYLFICLNVPRCEQEHNRYARHQPIIYLAKFSIIVEALKTYRIPFICIVIRKRSSTDAIRWIRGMESI